MSAHRHQQLANMCQRNGQDIAVITEWLASLLPGDIDIAVSLYCETANRITNLES